MIDLNQSVLALDVGDKRIGVAIAYLTSRLPSPLLTLENSEKVLDDVKKIVLDQDAVAIVVGLPRDLESRSTEQTKATRAFIDRLKERVKISVFTQDEALTSVRARQELENRKKPFNKTDIDALAATYILEDFLGDKENLIKLGV